MFLVYIDDASDYICSSSTVALFADESKLYRAIVQPSWGNHLPIDLDDLHKWSQDWSMDFSGIKCNKVMHISKKKTPSAANGNYTLDGQQLESVPFNHRPTHYCVRKHVLDKAHRSHRSKGQQDPLSPQKSLQRDA